MADVPDPYRGLGVRRGATPAEIKSAHRRLAKVHHPDAGGDGARFLAVQAAYQILSDPDERRRWDAAHAPGPMAPGESYEPGRAAGPGRRPDRTRERRGAPRRRPPPVPTEGGPRAGRPGQPGPRQAPGSSGAASPEPASGEAAPASAGAGDRAGADGSVNGAAGREQADPGIDVYSRSSGAAWSAASRAYFRKVAADIPRGARMGHSSWTGRTGWEPSAEEIARVAVRRTARRRARPSRRPIVPAWTRPAADPAQGTGAGENRPTHSMSAPNGPSSIRRLADRVSRALGL